MNKLLSFISLLMLASSQLFAGTYTYSNLSEIAKKNIVERIDNFNIIYNETMDEVVIDEVLDQQLRIKGILSTEDGVKRTACTGGGGEP
jgi:hypothetical protein